MGWSSGAASKIASAVKYITPTGPIIPTKHRVAARKAHSPQGAHPHSGKSSSPLPPGAATKPASAGQGEARLNPTLLPRDPSMDGVPEAHKTLSRTPPSIPSPDETCVEVLVRDDQVPPQHDGEGALPREMTFGADDVQASEAEADKKPDDAVQAGSESANNVANCKAAGPLGWTAAEAVGASRAVAVEVPDPAARCCGSLCDPTAAAVETSGSHEATLTAEPLPIAACSSESTPSFKDGSVQGVPASEEALVDKEIEKLDANLNKSMKSVTFSDEAPAELPAGDVLPAGSSDASQGVTTEDVVPVPPPHCATRVFPSFGAPMMCCPAARAASIDEVCFFPGGSEALAN